MPNIFKNSDNLFVLFRKCALHTNYVCRYGIVIYVVNLFIYNVNVLIIISFHVKKILLLCFTIFVFFSCNTSKNIIYLQDLGKTVNFDDSTLAKRPDVVIKPGDLLTITVNSNTPEAALPFNLPLLPGGEGMQNYGMAKSAISSGAGLQNYLVDNTGNLDFPVLRRIKAAGITKTELVQFIKSRIYPHYMKEEPIITVRYANYKVSILGEVAKPGAYNVDDEKLDLLEAIAMAGDLTIYGQRANVLLIREDFEGNKTTYRIDLRDKRLVNSPFYFLQQNDVLYVQPNNPRSRGSALGAAEALTISVVGTLISLTSLIINIVK